jgi:hypothetical protein
MKLNGTPRHEYFYQAFGLKIHSDLELSELLPSDAGRHDVRIRLGKLDERHLAAELNGGITRRAGGVTARASTLAITFQWRGVGRALVQRGCDVIIEPEAGIDERDLSPYVNGSILAVLLQQRGLMVLHASAVVVDGKATAFLGDKGVGKSTLAAFLESRGHTVLTDDLVPIKFESDEALVSPGFPRIRLWRDSLESLGLDPRTVPMINSFVDKYSYRCSEKLINESVSLSRLYVLEEVPETRIERLSYKESFIEIVRNCYFGRYIDATGQTASHFRNCAELARIVAVYKLKRPHDFNALPEVSRLIENHS